MRFENIPVGSFIHCETEDEAKVLLKALDEIGYIWGDDWDGIVGASRLTEVTYFDDYKQYTCYGIWDRPDKDNEITNEDIRELEANDRVIEFSEIDFGDELEINEPCRLEDLFG